MLTIFVLSLVIFCSGCYSNKSFSQQTVEQASLMVFDEDGLKGNLIVCKDSKDGEILYALHITNEKEEAYNFLLNKVEINKEVQYEYEKYINLGPQEETYVTLDTLNSCAKIANIEKIDSLTFYFIDGKNGDDPNERFYTVEIKTPITPGVVHASYKKGRADEQVLVDNEQIRITLLGLGNYLSKETVKLMEGLVLFENKSEDILPIGVMGIRINYMDYDVVCKSMSLNPGESSFINFYVVENNRNSIQSISNISLLILSKEEEITGTVRAEGGSWYDVTLSEAVDEKEMIIEGEKIFDENDIQIYYQGQQVNTYNSENRGTYIWDFLVINNSEEDIEVHFKNEKTNGKEAENSLIQMDHEVGTKGKRHIQLWYHYKDGQERPIIQFTLQFRSRGGGSILYQSEKEYVFKSEDNVSDILE